MLKLLKRFLRLGWWRVRYTDGNVSASMRYSRAKNLSEIFHGTVEFVE